MPESSPTRSTSAGHRPPRPTPWLTVLLALLLTCLALPAAAAAGDHELLVSEPGAREQLERPPGFVTLAFDEPVDPSLAKVLVLDSSGANVTTGELIVEGTNVSSQLLDGLARGTYTVHYRLARADGSPQGGTFQFSYGPGTFTGSAEQTWSGQEDEPEVLAGEDPNGGLPAPPSPGTTPPSGPSDSPVPSAPADPTDPATPTSTPTPPAGSGPAARSATPAAAPPAGAGTPSTGVLVLGAAVLCGLVAGGAGLVLRRRRR